MVLLLKEILYYNSTYHVYIPHTVIINTWHFSYFCVSCMEKKYLNFSLTHSLTHSLHGLGPISAYSSTISLVTWSLWWPYQCLIFLAVHKFRDFITHHTLQTLTPLPSVPVLFHLSIHIYCLSLNIKYIVFYKQLLYHLNFTFIMLTEYNFSSLGVQIAINSKSHISDAMWL
jgi:hypothetical protein